MGSAEPSRHRQPSSRIGCNVDFRPAPFVYVRSHFLALPSALLATVAGSIVVQEVNGADADMYDSWPQLRSVARLLTLVLQVQYRLANAIVVVTPGLEEPCAVGPVVDRRTT